MALRNCLDLDQWRYLGRAALWRTRSELSRCPVCDTDPGKSVGRKAGITLLCRCPQCELLYRVPREPAAFSQRYYQKAYRSSLATGLPSATELETMKADNFAGTEKNFSPKIDVLTQLAGPSSDTSPRRVLDYGSSWGYGLWQLRETGFEAVGFEISEPRAEYGQANLGVDIYTDIEEVIEEEAKFDFIFSNHVFEHLPDPSQLVEHAKRLLKPGGKIVGWFPNGSDSHRAARPKGYHHSWGRLHGVYLEEKFLATQFGDWPYLFLSGDYGQSPDLSAIDSWDGKSQTIGDLSRPEMLFVATRPEDDSSSIGLAS